MQRSIAKKPIEKSKWVVKKCPTSTPKNKKHKNQNSRGKKRNNRGDTWKANNKMVNLNSTVSIITLNTNGLNTPIKS